MPSNRESEPHKPHAASIRKQHLSGIDSSPKIADNGTPGLGQATKDTGELKATSHSCQMSQFESSLSLLANSSQMQPRVECSQDCPLRAPYILIFLVFIVLWQGSIGPSDQSKLCVVLQETWTSSALWYSGTSLLLLRLRTPFQDSSSQNHSRFCRVSQADGTLIAPPCTVS